MNNSHQRVFALSFPWRDYLELCKPRVVAVMLLTAIVGMCLATPEFPPLVTVISATLGIGLMASGAAAVNHVMDQSIDAKMARTHRRPLPQGKIDETRALLFAAFLSLAGIAVLLIWTNILTAWLTLGALIGYALVYTMLLKRATPLNIVIGGIAGAAPPLLGWVAVTGQINPDSLLLVLIIFAWTPPHFWALCIHKKDDYARAGVPMLPVTHGEQYTRLQILLYTVLMVLTTLFPFMTGMSGVVYLVGVTVINLRFFQWAVRVYLAKDSTAPMAMFWFSVKYIMWLFAVLLVDHYIMGLH